MALVSPYNTVQTPHNHIKIYGSEGGSEWGREGRGVLVAVLPQFHSKQGYMYVTTWQQCFFF